tara:strand:+ start:441 stop:659 length:219 start_codon:yes stop_codon:yes gene_type:complete
MTRENQIILVCIIIGFFIYFRKLDYYEVIPRENLLAAVLISIWSYISLKQPWFIIAGLIFLNLLDRSDLMIN